MVYVRLTPLYHVNLSSRDGLMALRRRWSTHEGYPVSNLRPRVRGHITSILAVDGRCRSAQGRIGQLWLKRLAAKDLTRIQGAVRGV